jgi:hypothetical protein
LEKEIEIMFSKPIFIVFVLLGFACTADWMILVSQTIDSNEKTEKVPNSPDIASSATVSETRCYVGTVQIVDDETGKPIEYFSVQNLLPGLPNSPGEIRWGGEESTLGGHRDGRFSIRSDYIQYGLVEFRVLAGGYLPQSVRISAEKDGTIKTTTVRMNRGSAVLGRVLDHEGKPVKDARVFLRSPGRLRMENGQFNYGDDTVGRNVVLTDADGRFIVAGAGKDATQIIVLATHLYVWAVPAPKEGSKEELIIHLPQPATLKVIMDIPGAVQGNEQRLVSTISQGPRSEPAGKDVWIRLQLQTWDMEGWKNAGDFVQTRAVPNPGEVVFENLTPGLYDFCRVKMFRLGDRGSGAMCDRQLNLKLSPGETKVVLLVRKRGQRVGGEIRGLPEDVPGAWLTIRPAEVTGDPRNMMNEWKLPIFDCLTCKNDAKFLTSLLEPGQYKIVAEAYRPEPRGDVLVTGLRSPGFVGTALIKVEDDDPADPNKSAPFVTIEMKPRDRKSLKETKPESDK